MVNQYTHLIKKLRINVEESSLLMYSLISLFLLSFSLNRTHFAFYKHNYVRCLNSMVLGKKTFTLPVIPVEAIKVTVYLLMCFALKQYGASVLNSRYLNPYIKLNL